jgi:hypothetical protein
MGAHVKAASSLCGRDNLARGEVREQAAKLPLQQALSVTDSVPQEGKLNYLH